MAEQDRDQRTEDATPQRIRKAYEEGQIGFSTEFMGGIVLAVSAVYFWLLGEWFFGSLGETVRERSTLFSPMVEEPRMILTAFSEAVIETGVVCLALFAPLLAAIFLSGALQTRFNVTFKPLNLKWDKLSIPAGIKRIFDGRSVVRGLMSIAKAAFIVLIIYLIAASRIEEIHSAGKDSFQQMMYIMCEIILYISLAVAATLILIGIADLAYQKWKHLQDLKMSMQDIRDEHKESEGDPLVRARVRRLQAEMGRKRMLEKVPKATVVVTNPTHFAVALQYENGEMDAPVVTAKGADNLAKRIIEVARENGVPVVERKPVARFLYHNIKIGSPIPYELYQAVAEILNYISRFRNAS
ncbi:MAG: flagellar biosynthesis protein FlhB [Planctomycetota bacterium]